MNAGRELQRILDTGLRVSLRVVGGSFSIWVNGAPRGWAVTLEEAVAFLQDIGAWRAGTEVPANQESVAPRGR